MSRKISRRATALVLIVVLVGGWLVVRPSVAAAQPFLVFVEFPVALLVLPLVLWWGLRPRRLKKVEPWRKHEQIVRRVPDPALARESAAVRDWIETGKAPDAAERVFARATRIPEKTLFKLMSEATSRHAREVLVKRRFNGE